MAMAERFRLCVRLLLVVVLFAGGLLITGFIYPILQRLQTSTTAQRQRNCIKRWWLICFGRVIGLKVERIGEPAEGGCLLVSNHISWLDICLIGQCVPAHFVAKDDIASWPVVGFIAKRSGTVFIRRANLQGAKATADSVAWLLKRSQPVCIFPEGTTSNGLKLLPFHTFLFNPALLSKAPVQAIALEYLGQAKTDTPFIGDDEFIPHLIKVLSAPETRARIIFHPVIDTAGQSRQNLCVEIRESIVGSLEFAMPVHSLQRAG
jgi:lyso-ornithine lipid O-acyltransferase